MSFHKNDRKSQSKKGKSFPEKPEHGAQLFVQAVTSALNEEYGGGPSAVKTVARVTLADERAVRNWFEGKNGPNGEYLVKLIRHSDVVLEAVLALADRSDRALAVSLNGLRFHLVEAVAAIAQLQPPVPLLLCLWTFDPAPTPTAELKSLMDLISSLFGRINSLLT
jgi:hypothetical protein